MVVERAGMANYYSICHVKYYKGPTIKSTPTIWVCSNNKNHDDKIEIIQQILPPWKHPYHEILPTLPSSSSVLAFHYLSFSHHSPHPPHPGMTNLHTLDHPLQGPEGHTQVRLTIQLENVNIKWTLITASQ